MLCDKCGKEIKEDSGFCNYCGNKINTVNTKNVDIIHKKDGIDDEIYKVCPNCGKLIKWKDRVCSYCDVPVHEPQSQELRGGITHPVNSDKNFRTVTPKRPISIVLSCLLGAAFLITLLSLIGVHLTLLAIIIYFPIFLIITFSLIFVNLRKIKSRSLGFLITTCALLVILIISSVAFSNIQNKKNIVKATTQSTEKANVIAAEATETTTTVSEVIETTDNIELKESTYIAEALILSEMITTVMEKGSKAAYSFANGEITMAEHKTLTEQTIKDTNTFYDVYLNLKPPDRFKTAHDQLGEAMKHFLNSSIYLQRYIDTENMDEMVTNIKNATTEIQLGAAYVKKATDEVNKLK